MKIQTPIARENEHADYVRNRPCLICGDDVHVEWCHIRTTFYPFIKDNTKAKRPPPWFTVPLCNRHHAEQHDIGEAAFWDKYFIGIRNALTIGLLLYCNSGDTTYGDELIRRWRPPLGIANNR